MILINNNKSLNILPYKLLSYNKKKVFIQFNTSLCSSAPVERMFSLAGLINNHTRNKSSDVTFEKSIFLKENKTRRYILSNEMISFQMTHNNMTLCRI